MLATAGVALATAALLCAGIGTGIPATALLLFAAGAATGALFGYARRAGAPAPGAVVAPLYATALAGGSLGALAGTLVLPPLLGLPATALLLGLGALALLLFV